MDPTYENDAIGKEAGVSAGRSCPNEDKGGSSQDLEHDTEQGLRTIDMARIDQVYRYQYYPPKRKLRPKTN